MPFANNNGIHIHYETAGDGPPLVLLHGFAGWLEGWIDTGYVDALKGEYRLIVMDLRGHGTTSAPHHPQAYRLDLTAGDVIAVLDDLGLDQAHMWGYSMGARLVWGIAHFYPERCRSLIVGADFPFEPDPAEPMPGWQLDQIEMLNHGQDTFVRTLMGLAEPWVRPEWGWAERLAAMDLEALLAFRSKRERVGLLDTLPGLDIPCLLYAGDQDPCCPLLRRWVERMPRASLVVLPGVGHLQGFFESDLIVPQVREFLAGAEEERQIR
ncbi:MAG: alpha/beta fold hydrolase [Anaerolineae bacterium]